MLRKPGSILRSLLLAALILSASAPARAAAIQVEDQGAGYKNIEIGSTYSFGKTPVGSEVSRTFKLVNEDKARSMRIYGLWISDDPNNQSWAITKKPTDWIPPGESADLTLLFVAIKPGARKMAVSWYVEMKPVNEEEDKDNFFVFNVEAEATEAPAAAEQ